MSNSLKQKNGNNQFVVRIQFMYASKVKPYRNNFFRFREMNFPHTKNRKNPFRQFSPYIFKRMGWTKVTGLFRLLPRSHYA